MVQDKRLEQSTQLVTFSTPIINAFGVRQMEKAFAAGYDPSLELAKSHFPGRSDSDGKTVDGDFDDYDQRWTERLRRKEQDTVDHIIHGQEHGHYFMLLGPKVSAHFFKSLLAIFNILPT
jgi:hypothetical protein